MSGNQRLGLIALTVVVAVAGFVVLRPTQQDDSKTAATPAADKDSSTKANAGTAAKEPKPRVAQVRIRNGKPVGGARTISFRTGQTARINVTADAPGALHLHGYDIQRPVSPGKTTEFRFKADIEGVFEFEEENGGEDLASVEVSPR